MKKIWLLITASLFFTACSGVKGIIPTGSTAEAKPKAGDRVLYKQSREGFFEGVVESVEDARYKIRAGDSISVKEESDVYPLPGAGAKAEIKTGDMVVAKMGDGIYWSGSEVIGVSGEVVEVKDLNYGKTMNLSADKIMPVRPAAVAEFQKLKAEKEFSAKAAQAKPRAPAGYKPKTGDRVVAQWTTNTWYDGEVSGISGNKAKIKWQNFKESEHPFDSVVPFPTIETASASMPAAGSFVLVKPEGGGSGQWNYAQVIAVNDNSADVKFASGKTRPIKADEYIALN